MQASGEIRERVRCHQIRSTCLLRLARREAAVAEGHPGRLRHGAGATEPCADVSFVPEEEGRRADGSQQPAGYLMAKEWLGPDPPHRPAVPLASLVPDTAARGASYFTPAIAPHWSASSAPPLPIASLGRRRPGAPAP
jgi:hypothetical protein